MNKIIIDEKLLNNQLNAQVNNESKLYIVDSSIYKILRNDLRLIDRQLVIQKLIETKPLGVCNPEKLIVNEKNEFIGYRMPYLKEYKNLDITNTPYELRIIYLKNINQIFRRLLRLGLYFHDHHQNNYMVNENKIILVDSDSAEQINKNNYKYEELYLYYCCKNLCNLSLSLLLGTNINVLNRHFGKKEIKKLLSEINDGALNEIIKYAYGSRKNPTEFYIDDLVDLINKDKLNKLTLSKPK